MIDWIFTGQVWMRTSWNRLMKELCSYRTGFGSVFPVFCKRMIGRLPRLYKDQPGQHGAFARCLEQGRLLIRIDYFSVPKYACSLSVILCLSCADSLLENVATNPESSCVTMPPSR